MPFYGITTKKVSTHDSNSPDETTYRWSKLLNQIFTQPGPKSSDLKEVIASEITYKNIVI